MANRRTSQLALLGIAGTLFAAPSVLATPAQKDDFPLQQKNGKKGFTLDVSGTLVDKNKANIGTFTGEITNMVLAPGSGHDLSLTGVLSGEANTGGRKVKIDGQKFTVGVDGSHGTSAAADTAHTAAHSPEHDHGEVVVPIAYSAAIAAQVPQVCDILFLDIQPIFLDVLGLQVNLSRVTLDINAVSGAGRLLGNLLCALVGLLDQGLNLGAILTALFDAINQLLSGLFG
jgi:hypothetical protein